MHIGIVLPSVPGYSETFFRSKIHGLQSNGFRVTLFVKNRKGVKEFICPVKVHPMLAKNAAVRLLQTLFLFIRLLILAPKSTFKLIAIMRQKGNSLLQGIQAAVIGSAILPEKLDWLHFGFATPAIQREFLGKAIGAKVAVSFRGFDINQTPLTEKDPYKLFWPQVDKVHSISRYLVLKANELGLPKSTPYEIITPAVDAALFAQRKKKVVPNSILLVSRLHWIKGIESVLQAISICNNPTITLTIIGDGDEHERLVFAAYQLGILERVNFLGKQPHDKVLEALNSHEIFIQYSHQEGFCNAALEAQAAGLLCIVSDAEGLQENVLDGKTGWVVPKRNPEALAAKISEVISLTDQEKEMIGSQARERVTNEFNLEKQQQEFIAFYSDLA